MYFVNKLRLIIHERFLESGEHLQCVNKLIFIKINSLVGNKILILEMQELAVKN